MAEVLFNGPGDWRCRFDCDTDYGRLARLLVLRNDHDSSALAVITISLEERSAADVLEPTVYMREREMRGMLQAIVDEAWRAGIKPKALDDEVRDGAHQRRHLDDMRALVAKMSDTVLP